MALYQRDGGVVITSNNPPSSGSPVLGVWERTGEHQYREIFETFTFDSSGQPSGLLQIRTETLVDETGDRQTGRAQIYFQPPGSSTFLPAGTRHYTSTRITVLTL